MDTEVPKECDKDVRLMEATSEDGQQSEAPDCNLQGPKSLRFDIGNSLGCSV
jgi:hypothetical protein